MKSIVNMNNSSKNQQRVQELFQYNNDPALKKLQQLYSLNNLKQHEILQLQKQIKQIEAENQNLDHQIQVKQNKLQTFKNQLENQEKIVQQDEAEMQQLIGQVQKFTGVGQGIPLQDIQKLLELQFQGYGDSQICLSCYQQLSQGAKCKYLPCSHMFHSQCINAHLKVNKVCPGCGQEVIL